MCICITGGWWHLNWGGWARGNGWSGKGVSKNGFHVFDAIPFAPFQPLL
jgi:hypothetical protein